MIEIFEGRIGGGKTYTALTRIIDHLAKGGTVCTNIRLCWPVIKALIADRYRLEAEDDQLWMLPNEQISTFYKHVPWGDLRGSGKTRVLVVVDEAHLYFNARDWAQANRETLAFLTQSDKVSVDIIFISQSITNIDKQFRVLMQYTWRFRDLEKWTIPGLGISYPTIARIISLGVNDGKQILAVKMDYDGVTQLDRKFLDKEPELFACYETAALLTDFDVVPKKATTRVLKTAQRQEKPMVKILIPLGLILGIFCAYTLVKSLTSKGEAAPTSASATPPPGPPIAMFPPSNRFDKPGKEPVQDQPATRYDIYEEEFRAFYGGEKSLVTGSGWYQLGEMSSKGLVTAVSDRRARIDQPNGRPGYIVATRYVNGEPPKKAETSEKGAPPVQKQSAGISSASPKVQETDTKPPATPTPAKIAKMTRAERIRGGYAPDPGDPD